MTAANPQTTSARVERVTVLGTLQPGQQRASSSAIIHGAGSGKAS